MIKKIRLWFKLFHPILDIFLIALGVVYVIRFASTDDLTLGIWALLCFTLAGKGSD